MLIDFEELHFIDDMSEEVRVSSQQDQLWQLFALIGNVCSNKVEPFNVPWGAFPKTRNKTDVKERLIPTLQECQFDQGMVWRDSTGTDVAQTYDDLITWCGL